MRLFRFDEEVSLPIAQFGSRVRVGPLTGDDARVRVQVMHLPPNGLIGRHRARSPQLFAVVTGHGRVSGHDRRSRTIGPGYAALWDAGEEHDAASDDGLTAVCVEGEFEVWALSVTQDIVVGDYDPAWPAWFDTVRRHVWPAVRDVARRIDHVGSTAVPGLAAKPIIDLDVVVASDHDVSLVIEQLATIGYRWRGDLGVPGREAFTAIDDQGLPPHNLYVVVENNQAHVDHWLLRDVLRTEPEARQRYAALKKRNAQRADRDMDVYVAAKADFVGDLLARARAERGLPPACSRPPS
ncbi:MAG: GrpB family protein [Nocardioidaceae bacterium]